MNFLKEYTYCFTGHRPQSLPWKFRESGIRFWLFKKKLKKIVEKSINDGYTHFISGMALGVDMIAAEIGATSIRTSSSVPTTALQIYGQGVFEVGSVPVSFSLVNRTGDTVTLGTSLIQADLIIVKL